MKKTFILVGLLAAVYPAYASTCETRVDAHTSSTTSQRVKYCLTPEKPAPQKSGPEVLYSRTSFQTPDEQKTSKPAEHKQEYFEYNQVAVTRGYAETDQFPQLKNDILSDKELQAKQDSPTLAEKKEATYKHPARVMKKSKKTTKKKETSTSKIVVNKTVSTQSTQPTLLTQQEKSQTDTLQELPVNGTIFVDTAVSSGNDNLLDNSFQGN